LNFGRIIIISFLIFLSQISASSYENNRIDRPINDWNTLSTLHFEIVYPAGQEGLALRTAELAERGYVRVSDYLGHEISKVITVLIYASDRELLRDDIPVAPGGASIGMITVQFHGSYAELQRILTREFVFAFQDDILSESLPGMTKLSAVRIPPWVRLGLAEYIAYGYDRRAEMFMFDLIGKNHHSAITDVINGGCADLVRCRREGQAFFFFMEKQYGRTAIGELLRDLWSLRHLDEVIFTATGKSVEEIKQEWSSFIISRYHDFKKIRRGDGKTIRSGERIHFTAAQRLSAVSPDGNRIARLVVNGVCPELVIFNAKTKPDKKIETILMKFPLGGRFESVHPADNSISWTGDGKSIVMAARSDGQECICYIDAVNGRSQLRIPLPFRAVMYPSVSRDGRRIAFTGIAGSSGDIYIYDRDTEKIIRVTDDDFADRYPTFGSDGRSVIYSSNWNSEGDVARNEYDIYRCDLQTGKRTMLSPGGGTNMQAEAPAVYYPSYVDPSQYHFSSYSDFIRPAWLRIGGAGDLNSGYLFFLNFGMSDYLGKHRLVISSHYSHESQDMNHDVNADVAYCYHPDRWHVGIGAFRQASPYPAFSALDAGDWHQQIAFGLISMEHYGGYASAGYSFSRYLNISLRAGAGRYGKSYPDAERRPDLHATAGNIILSLEYDNLRRGAMVPVNGFMGRLQAEQCIDFTGGKSFSSANIDLQGFILIDRRFLIALRGASGSVFGKNRGHFNYYLGGYDTLRGYNTLSISGRNMILVNAEFGIAGTDWMSFGLPLSGGLGNVAGIAFIDAGSAWDGRLSTSGGLSGDFGDIKMDFGFGIRFAVYPLLIFKLDFAWPFDKRSIKKNDILFSAVFMY